MFQKKWRKIGLEMLRKNNFILVMGSKKSVTKSQGSQFLLATVR